MLDIVFLGAESARMRADRGDFPLCCAAAGSARVWSGFGAVLRGPWPPYFLFLARRTGADDSTEIAVSRLPGHEATDRRAAHEQRRRNHHGGEDPGDMRVRTPTHHPADTDTTYDAAKNRHARTMLAQVSGLDRSGELTTGGSG
ncbi:hypothetical protein [Burkholderia sp. Nafp2/4-1b]|uniref:hypothetical protein n=1 Tax=Burkholderia sp. Nafp2/4-1b TaxID=2116686 RepID=UPI0013CF1969|nr:hypothetical protein [Burkholderia sp. Nafp2/4-1b]